MDTFASPHTGTHTQQRSAPSALLEWSAPSSAQHTRTWRWYASAGAMGLLCLLYSIAYGAWTFSIVLVCTTALYLYVHRTEPKKKHIAIHESGVMFEQTFYRWDELTGFWILVGNGYEEVHIARKKKLQNDIVIHTGQTDPFQVRAVLSQHLPELHDRTEKLIDNIIRICKL